MKLPFDNLMSFHSVVTHGSFSNGARKLGKSQSTVSGAVKSLENELGYELIDRSESGIKLTSRGKKVYQLATPIVSRYIELKYIAESLGKTERGKLRVGIDPLVFNHDVKRVLFDFSEKFPETELTILTKPSHILGQYLHHHKIDIAIGNPYHKTDFGFNVDELFLVNCHWVAHKDLLRTPLSIRTRVLLLDGCEDTVDLSNIAQHNVWILDDSRTVLDMCIAQKGIAFLPQHLLDQPTSTDVLSPIVGETFLFGKQIYASLMWPQHADFSQQHQWIHDKLRKR